MTQNSMTKSKNIREEAFFIHKFKKNRDNG